MPDPSTSTLSPRVREKRLKRRREILHAALEAVREQGWHGTTLDDIAGRLGIRKTALYHYFPDKDSILYACHRESLAELDRIIRESGECCDCPRARLEHVIREHVRVMTETLEGSPLAFEVPSLPPDRRAEVIAGRDRYEQALRDIIAEGMETGVFRAVDPKTAVFVILGAINWIARWYHPEGGTDPEEIGRRFAGQLIGGLGS